jgi:hypothetical protein
MRWTPRLIALVMFGATGHTGGLAAQVAGMPVRNAGVGPGIGIAADVGFPNADAGKGFALAATGAIGLGPFGLTASVATWNQKGTQGSSINSVGFTGNIRVFGGAEGPVSVTLQGGGGYDNAGGSNNWHIPVGVGLAVTIPTQAFSIKPWIAPRYSIAGDSPDETHFGISGGVDLGLRSGLTLRAMYDRLSAGAGESPSVLSLGLGFKVGK